MTKDNKAIGYETDNKRASRRSDAVDIEYLLLLCIVISFPLMSLIPLRDTMIRVGIISTSVFAISITEILTIVLFATLCLRRESIVIPKTRTVTYLCLFLLSLIISAVINGIAIPVLTELVKWVLFSVLVLSCALTLSNRRRLDTALKCIVLAGAIKALWTIPNFVLYGYPGRRFSTTIEGMAVVVLLALAAGDVIDPNRDYNWQIHLLFIPLLTAIILGQERKVWVAIAFASLIIIAILLYNVIAQKLPKSLQKPIFVGITAGGLLFVSGLGLLALRQGVIELALSALPANRNLLELQRYHIFMTGFEMVRHNPLFGVGPDMWFNVKDTYATDGFLMLEAETDSDWGSHSTLLKIFSELGTLGILSFLGFILSSVKGVVGYYNQFERHIVLSTIALLLFSLVILLFRSPGIVTRITLAVPMAYLISLYLNQE